MDNELRELQRKWEAGDEEVAAPLLRRLLRVGSVDLQEEPHPPLEIIPGDRKNVTIIRIPYRYEILVSYTTPVAFEELSMSSKFRRCVSSERYSSATSRHINEWLGGRSFIEVAPRVITDVLRVGHTPQYEAYLARLSFEES